jgi:hypothetical protein
MKQQDLVYFPRRTVQYPALLVPESWWGRKLDGWLFGVQFLPWHPLLLQLASLEKLANPVSRMHIWECDCLVNWVSCFQLYSEFWLHLEDSSPLHHCASEVPRHESACLLLWFSTSNAQFGFVIFVLFYQLWVILLFSSLQNCVDNLACFHFLLSYLWIET